jgi:hypothetical protein
MNIGYEGLTPQTSEPFNGKEVSSSFQQSRLLSQSNRIFIHVDQSQERGHFSSDLDPGLHSPLHQRSLRIKPEILSYEQRNSLIVFEFAQSPEKYQACACGPTCHNRRREYSERRTNSTT